MRKDKEAGDADQHQENFENGLHGMTLVVCDAEVSVMRRYRKPPHLPWGQS
jgi:hypothetical protein